jgi:hypothetical protein
MNTNTATADASTTTETVILGSSSGTGVSLQKTKTKTNSKGKSKGKNTVTKTKSKAGRPRAVVNYPESGSFTIHTLASFNPTLCTLTLRNYVKKDLRRRAIAKMKETLPTGGVGKPSFQYVIVKGNKVSTVKISQNQATVSTETVNYQPAPAIELAVGLVGTPQ